MSDLAQDYLRMAERKKRFSIVVLLAVAAGVLQIVWYSLSARYSPPSLAVLFLGFTAIILGMAGLVAINQPGSAVKGRPLAGIAMVLGLLSTLFYSRQLRFFLAGQEQREMSNLADIAKAAATYAATNNKYPDSLATLWEAQPALRAKLVSPFSMKPQTALTDGPATQPASIRPGYIEENSDYIYIGAGLTSVPIEKNPAPARAVLVAFGKDENSKGDRAVAYADGRGEYVDADKLVTVAADNNDARLKLGFPIVALDQPMGGAATQPAPAPAPATRASLVFH